MSIIKKTKSPRGERKPRIIIAYQLDKNREDQLQQRFNSIRPIGTRSLSQYARKLLLDLLDGHCSYKARYDQSLPNNE